MTIHAIRIAGDPVLHNPTRTVDRFDAGLRNLVNDMFETMYASEGVGLAANQIGVDLRVFVYDCPDADGGWHAGVVVNPEVRTSELPDSPPDPEADQEGCLSVPGEKYPTPRARWAVVTGADLDGNAIEVHGNGMLARCFQHETDHLDGCLYLDRLVGEDAEAAKEMVETNHWGVPGNSWLPEFPEGTTGPIDRDTKTRNERERGPLTAEPVRWADAP